MRTARLGLAVFALSGASLLAAPAALAQEAPAPCAYPFDCPIDGGTGGGGSAGGGSAGGGSAGGGTSGGTVSGGTTAGGSTSSGAVLPFTGGEAVLIGLTGAGAVAAGGLLLVAGRKRSHA